MFVALLFLVGADVAGGPKFPCLPKGLTSSDIVSAEWIGGKLRRVTVQDTLAHMKARCEREKLVDRNKREIRFYRVRCFGAPTDYALETTRRQAEELKTLRATYTLITLTCTPDGLPRP